MMIALISLTWCGIKQDNVCKRLSIIPGKQGNLQEMLVIMMFATTVLVT